MTAKRMEGLYEHASLIIGTLASRADLGSKPWLRGPMLVRNLGFVGRSFAYFHLWDCVGLESVTARGTRGEKPLSFLGLE